MSLYGLDPITRQSIYSITSQIYHSEAKFEALLYYVGFWGVKYPGLGHGRPPWFYFHKCCLSGMANCPFNVVDVPRHTRLYAHGLVSEASGDNPLGHMAWR